MEQEKEIPMLLKELLGQYGFSEVSIDEVSAVKGSFVSKTYVLQVPDEDSRFLIGQFGNNLQALQHIARMIVAKKFPHLSENVFFVDVNDYRKKKDQSIIDLARSVSREVEKEGKTILLRPMTAYERRLVHMELSKEKNITTESIGEGDDRQIAVKPL